MKRWLLLALIPLMAACSGETFQDKTRIPPDAPAYIKGTSSYPGVKIGKPYEIAGKRYYPKYEPDYDEVGLASWYGPNFHGKSTANGERYNQWAMTAAHKTLPMPSMVRVTRLDNGQSIIVRVNDRGPFADGRIIDLSRAAAEELGTDRMGLAKVRVEYLPDETERFIASVGKSKPAEMQVARSSYSKPKDVEYLTFDAPDDVIKTEKTPVAYKPEIQVAQNQYIETDSLPPLTAETHQQVETEIRQAEPTKKELGYVEDAFSVLDSIDNSHKPKFPQALPTDPEPIKNLRRVQKVDTPLYVQVASFSDRENAMSLAQKLSTISAVEVQEINVKGAMWYRVRLGPTYNQAIAEELKERVAEWGVKDARIIQDTPQ